MKKILLLLLFCCTGYMQMSFSQTRDTLCTPNASKEAIAVYRFLNDMKGKKILSGQMDSPWGIDEFLYIKNNTGKQPVIKGMDFMYQADNAGEVMKAINWWKAGGLPTIMWHWGAPGNGDGYEQSKMKISIDNCFIEGTTEYKAFWAELKLKADLLQQLRDANVPVLWRPYHELNGGWFWWSMGGAEQFKKLWITMFDYFVNVRELNNLIWVFCYTNSPDVAWYPGAQYVDIIGADTYNAGNGPQMSMYNAIKTIVNDETPLAYHECGIPPDPDQCLKQGGLWSWWMEWHTDWLSSVDKKYLGAVYNHDLVLTLDEMPNIMATYGWTLPCVPTTITPKVKTALADWSVSNKVNLYTVDSAQLSVEAPEKGTWNWNGYGTSGSDTLQKIAITNSGSANVTFTNACGAITTQSFFIYDGCTATTLSPLYLVYGKTWQTTKTISMYKGDSVLLAPQPSGKWSWDGGGTSGTSRTQLIKPEASCVATATYTNSCGRASSIDFTITVTNVGISNALKNSDNILLSPQPCTTQLNIEFGESYKNANTTYDLKILDLQGKIIYTEKTVAQRFLLNTSKLSAGMYILQIKRNNDLLRKKFLKE